MFRRLLLNPLVLIAPVAFLASIFYYHYTLGQSSASTPPRNILPNNTFLARDTDGFPTKWQLFPHIPGINFTTPAGYASPSSLRVESTNQGQRGNITITSPEANVEAGHTYFYKSYYRSSMPFDLIVQRTDDKGSVTRTIVRRYLASKEWTTASSVITADTSLRSVRFIYSLSGTGNIQVSDTYLQSDPTDVTLPTEPSLRPSSIPSLQQHDQGQKPPSGWTTFKSGENDAKFNYVSQSSDAPYLRTEVTNYKKGEAKWQYEPISVSPGDAFRFSLTYRSDQPVDVVAEYLLKNDERQFITLSTLLPATDWTTYQTNATAPPDTMSVVITAVVRENGITDTKQYALNQIPRVGSAGWRRPMLSYTFDDGWASAYQNSIALFDRAGSKATFYLNPSSIDTHGFMTSAQVTTLAGSGHEVASHGYEHRDFTTLNPAAIDYQLKYSNDYFRQVFNMQSVNFAAPFGSSDEQLTFYTRKYYDSARSTQDGINTKQTFDPYNLRVLYVGNDLPLDRLKEVIAQTQAAHGWLILVYHRIDTSTQGETATSPEEFRSQFEAVRTSGITVMTVKAALQEIRQQ